jgi:membrane protease YdiL (CAAX protease family)
MSDKKSYPGFWQSVLLLVIIVSIQLILLVPIIVVNFIMKVDLISHPLTLGLINLISIGITILIGKKLSKNSYQELFPLHRINSIHLLTVTVTSIGFSIVLSDLDNLVRIIIPMPDIIEKIFMDLVSNQETIWASLFTVVLVAAFSEEFLFRGLFYSGYEKRYGATKAIIYTALLFGLFHMNPWQFFGAAILGAIYAWWFFLTRNLALCVIGHGLNNLMPIIALRYFPIKGYSTDLSGPPEFQPTWLSIMGMALSAAGIWLTIKYLKPQKQTSSINSSESFTL